MSGSSVRRTKAIALVVALVAGVVAPASAEIPYDSYTYDWWGFPTPAPHAYVPAGTLSGPSLGLTPLTVPSDLFVAPDGRLYLVDSGNSRILVLDTELRLERVIDSFARDEGRDTFLNPQGVFVDERDHLYVADTGNSRVLEIGPDGRLVNDFGRPQTELLDPNAAWEPMKLVLDKARRLYVIARGVNKGLVELDSDGRFRGFMGANRVTPNALDYIWKLIATDEQRARMERFVPTEYSNATIDDDGYIFVTTASVGADAITESLNPQDSMPIRKLNLTGTDVLRTLDDQWWPVGDVSIGIGFGAMRSQFTDVTLGEAETYATLDRVRGRVFLYNSDGILLTAFGRIGDRVGNLRGPSSITFMGDRLLVLDSILNQVVVFRPTEYGRLLVEANEHYQERRYAESAAAWQRVSELNTNLEVAYAGIGKAQLRAGDYRGAMKSFKLAHVTSYYTKAFQLYRRDFVEANFGLMMGAVLASIAVAIVVRRIRRKGKQTNE